MFVLAAITNSSISADTLIFMYPITLACRKAKSLGKGKPGQAPSDRWAAFDLTMPGDWKTCLTVLSVHRTETQQHRSVPCTGATELPCRSRSVVVRKGARTATLGLVALCV